MGCDLLFLMRRINAAFPRSPAQLTRSGKKLEQPESSYWETAPWYTRPRQNQHSRLNPPAAVYNPLRSPMLPVLITSR